MPLISHSNNKIHFIKVSREPGTDPQINPTVIFNNKLEGKETTLILDTNVLIRMEKTVKNGNSWVDAKKNGLDKLIKLLARCPSHSLCLSPGLAFNEMPPWLASQSSKYFEEFLQKHLPNYMDSPNSFHKDYHGGKKDYGFEDLDNDRQTVLAISFSTLLLALMIEYFSLKSPIDKFRIFLNQIISSMDIISSKEVEIARYLFAPPAKQGTATANSMKKLRDNFGKTKKGNVPKTADEMLKIAFNGACDLHLITCSVYMSRFGLDGVPQDPWIATFDQKLAEFCSIYHYLDDGDETGKFSIMNINSEQENNNYWEDTLSIREKILSSRKNLNSLSDASVENMRFVAYNLISEARTIFDK